MRAVFGLVLIVGIALAGGAVMMVKDRIEAYQNALRLAQSQRGQAIPTVPVYVANKPLKYGVRLKKEDIRAVNWPKDAMPEGVFTDLDVLFPSDLARDGRYVLRQMEKNEPILAVKVTEPGQDAGISSQLAPGMRAFAIKVSVTTGVSGFLRPGDHVDVYWTGRPPSNRGQGTQGDITRLIQPHMELIAVDQKADTNVSEATIARTVTVSARPEQIAALAQAQNTGKLSLSLVGAEDDTIANLIEVDQRSLLGLGEIEAPQRVEKQKVCTIRTRRGAEVVDIPIPCSD